MRNARFFGTDSFQTFDEFWSVMETPKAIPGVSLYGANTWAAIQIQRAQPESQSQKKGEKADSQDFAKSNGVDGFRRLWQVKYLGDWETLALLYSSRQRSDEADELVKKGMTLMSKYQGPDLNPTYVVLVSAKVAMNESKNEYAERLFKEAIERDHADDEDPGLITIDAVDGLVKLYSGAKQYDRADQVASSCIRELNERHVEVSLHDKDLKSLFEDITNMYSENGMDKQEDAFLKQVKTLIDGIKDERNYQWSHGFYSHTAVNFYLSTDQYRDVIAILRPAYDDMIKHQSAPDYRIASNLGFSYAMDDQYEEAEPILKKAVESASGQLPERDPLSLMRAWIGLALTYSHRGQCHASKDAADKGAEIGREFGDHSGLKTISLIPLRCEAMASLNSGILAAKGNRNSDAERLLHLAIQQERSYIQKPGPVAFAASGELLKLYWAEGRNNEADVAASTCLQAINDQHLVVHLNELRSVILNAVHIYIQNRMEEQGTSFFRQLKLLVERDNSEYDNGLYQAAAYHFFESFGKYDGVIATLEPEYKHERESGSELAPIVLSNLGFAYAVVGRDDEAEPLLKKAISLLTDANDETQHGLHESWAGLAIVLFHQGACRAGKQAADKAGEFEGDPELVKYQNAEVTRNSERCVGVSGPR